MDTGTGLLRRLFGQGHPVHLEFIDSWNAFNAVLTERFIGLPGHEKILLEEYILQDFSKKKEITKNAIWRRSFLPGRSIYMTMVFGQLVLSRNLCPGCLIRTDQEAGNDEVTCLICGMKLSTVTEIGEQDSTTEENSPIPASNEGQLGSISRLQKRKSKRPRDFEADSIREFKRVRLTKSHGKGPWAHQEDDKLLSLARSLGPFNWVRISHQMGGRSPKQCRERYHGVLELLLDLDHIIRDEHHRHPTPPDGVFETVDSVSTSEETGSRSERSLAPEPPIIQTGLIHRDVITHYRHIDHGRLDSFLWYTPRLILNRL